MTIKQIDVERVSVTSSKPFENVVAALDAAVGHPDVEDLNQKLRAAGTWSESEQLVRCAVGKSGLMEFARYDLGGILRKKCGPASPRTVRLVIGNPLIMVEMLKDVPDAGSYAPVTILIDERPDGIHLSYDRMASFLDTCGSPDALNVARDLDSKVERLLTEAAT
jgi:uncharacterized protein (DUF302 family)